MEQRQKLALHISKDACCFLFLTFSLAAGPEPSLKVHQAAARFEDSAFNTSGTECVWPTLGPIKFLEESPKKEQK